MHDSVTLLLTPLTCWHFQAQLLSSVARFHFQIIMWSQEIRQDLKHNKEMNICFSGDYFK